MYIKEDLIIPHVSPFSVPAAPPGLRGGSRAVAHPGASRGAPPALGLRLRWAGLEPSLQAAEMAHLPSLSCPLLLAPQLL